MPKKIVVLLEIVWVDFALLRSAGKPLILRAESTFFGARNLSRCTDEQDQATPRRLPLSWIRSAGQGSWHLWRSRGGGHHTPPAPKKRSAACVVRCRRAYYDQRPRRVRDLSCGDKRVYLDFSIRRVSCPRCGGVKTRAAGLAGRQSALHQAVRLLRGPALPGEHRQGGGRGTVARLATVKELDKQYMREQLRRAGHAGAAGDRHRRDLHRQGHSYRIVVSDLERGRPIWFGGTGPLRGEPGRVLRLARARRNAAKSAWP